MPVTVLADRWPSCLHRVVSRWRDGDGQTRWSCEDCGVPFKAVLPYWSEKSMAESAIKKRRQAEGDPE